MEAFSLQTSVHVSEVPDDDSEVVIGAAGQAFLEGVSLVRKTSLHFFCLIWWSDVPAVRSRFTSTVVCIFRTYFHKGGSALGSIR